MLTGLVLLLLPLAGAADDVEGGANISATARVGTSNCTATLDGCGWLSFNDAAVFSPWVSARPNASVSARASMDIRLHGPSADHGLSSGSNQSPWSVRIDDAWVSARGSNTELKLGVQRLAWGVASGISVVDNVNPLNLEDPTVFDQRLSVLMGVAKAHTETLALTAALVPFFVPAAMPAVNVDLMANTDDVFDARLTGSREMTLGSLETRTTVPNDSLKNTAVAAQLRWTPAIGDFALSWYSGRDSLPQVSGDLNLLGYQTRSNAVDVGIPLVYARQHVLGFTSRAALPGDFTGWTEAALTLSDATGTQPQSAQLAALRDLGLIDAVPSPIPRTETQDGEPYVKWIVGADRAVGPVRIVGQWLHGFFTERSAADIRDYGLLGVSYSISPTVRIDTSAASDFDGYLAEAGLTFLHADTAEIKLAATHIDGADESSFGGLKSASNLRTTVSMRF